jgi:hypothetical protein
VKKQIKNREGSFQEVERHKQNFVSFEIADVSYIRVCQVNYIKLLEMNFFYLAYLFRGW